MTGEIELIWAGDGLVGVVGVGETGHEGWPPLGAAGLGWGEGVGVGMVNSIVGLNCWGIGIGCYLLVGVVWVDFVGIGES